MTENKNQRSFIDLYKSNFVLIFFTVFISTLSFLVGSLWTRLSYSQSGAAPLPTTDNAAEGQPLDQGPTVSAREQMDQIAKDLKLDSKKFSACLDNGNFTNKVSDQTSSGSKAGVNGTPGNFVVNLDSGKIVALRGAEPIENLQAVYDYLTKGSALPAGLTEPTTKPELDMPDLKNDHIRGNKNARIALIEYSDFSCPFCQRFHITAQQFLENNNNKVMWVYRHYPIPQLHPDAAKQAEASECAGQLGGEDMFWKYTDALYQVN